MRRLWPQGWQIQTLSAQVQGERANAVYVKVFGLRSIISLEFSNQERQVCALRIIVVVLLRNETRVLLKRALHACATEPTVPFLDRTQRRSLDDTILFFS